MTRHRRGNQAEKLAGARNRLLDTIAALIHPRYETITINGKPKHTQLTPLYTELQTTIAPKDTGHYHPRSVVLIWPAAFDTLTTIDTTVAAWHQTDQQPDHPTDTTPTRLQTMTAKTWRPQDTAMLHHRANKLDKWATTITELINPQPEIYLYDHQCPICEATHATQPDPADPNHQITTSALIIRGQDALCAACKTIWEYPRLPLLGRMLGIQPTAQIGA